MDVLNVVLETKSDEDILALYNLFILKDEVGNALKLRKAFLLHNMYRKDYSGVMATFIQTERADLMVDVFKKKEYYSGVTHLMCAKLVKQDLLDIETGDLEKIVRLEADVFPSSYFERIALYQCIRSYFGKSASTMFLTVVDFAVTTHELPATMNTEMFMQQRKITGEEDIERTYFDNKDNPNIFTREFTHLRDTFMLMFLHYWKINAMDLAELYLVRLIQITNPEGYMYPTLKFLENELFRKNIED